MQHIENLFKFMELSTQIYIDATENNMNFEGHYFQRLHWGNLVNLTFFTSVIWYAHATILNTYIYICNIYIYIYIYIYICNIYIYILYIIYIIKIEAFHIDSTPLAQVSSSCQDK